LTRFFPWLHKLARDGRSTTTKKKKKKKNSPPPPQYYLNSCILIERERERERWKERKAEYVLQGGLGS